MDKLPNILYVLEQPENWLTRSVLKSPPLKKYQIYGEYLRDVPILPDHISSRVEGWRIETWFRMDPRVSYEDILDRMSPEHRPRNKSTVQMRVLRFKKEFGLLGWVKTGKNYSSDRARIVRRLRDANIDLSLNTTRGISWGLIDLERPDLGRIRVPEPHVDISSVENVIRGCQLRSLVMPNIRPVYLAPSIPPLEPQASIGHPPPPMKRMCSVSSASATRSTSAISVATVATRTMLPYGKFILVLKSTEERANPPEEDRIILSQFHPSWTVGRARQLEYMLDPVRATTQGFRDEIGAWPPVVWDPVSYSTDVDIVYGDGRSDQAHLKTSGI